MSEDESKRQPSAAGQVGTVVMMVVVVVLVVGAIYRARQVNLSPAAAPPGQAALASAAPGQAVPPAPMPAPGPSPAMLAAADVAKGYGRFRASIGFFLAVVVGLVAAGVGIYLLTRDFPDNAILGGGLLVGSLVFVGISYVARNWIMRSDHVAVATGGLGLANDFSRILFQRQ
jgi:hypothetical protein